ncbi:hypothetical protein B7494_g2794 [Chlorociboria aeruginascens]|nr:hypothetical protein B7494_g2794 [Chlorociboria aeruginascens]
MKHSNLESIFRFLDMRRPENIRQFMAGFRHRLTHVNYEGGAPELRALTRSERLCIHELIVALRLHPNNSLLVQASLRFVGAIDGNDQEVLAAAQEFDALGTLDIWQRPQDDPLALEAAQARFERFGGVHSNRTTESQNLRELAPGAFMPPRMPPPSHINRNTKSCVRCSSIHRHCSRLEPVCGACFSEHYRCDYPPEGLSVREVNPNAARTGARSIPRPNDQTPLVNPESGDNTIVVDNSSDFNVQINTPAKMGSLASGSIEVNKPKRRKVGVNQVTKRIRDGAFPKKMAPDIAALIRWSEDDKLRNQPRLRPGETIVTHVNDLDRKSAVVAKREDSKLRISVKTTNDRIVHNDYGNKVDWNDRKSVDRLNRWRNQVLRRCSGGDGKRRPTFLETEIDTFLDILESHLQLLDVGGQWSRIKWKAVVATFNELLAGKIFKAGEKTVQRRWNRSERYNGSAKKMSDGAPLDEDRPFKSRSVGSFKNILEFLVHERAQRVVENAKAADKSVDRNSKARIQAQDVEKYETDGDDESEDFDEPEDDDSHHDDKHEDGGNADEAGAAGQPDLSYRSQVRDRLGKRWIRGG